MSTLRVMVIDDDADVRALMQEVLADEGYEVVVAVDAASAYSRILTAPPDLLVLDIRMQHPRAGWVLLDLLRAHPRFQDTPVLVCTGDQRFLQEKAQRLRAKGCLTLAKPFEISMLLELVSQALDSVHTD